jgi:hypothetical protein
MAPATSGGSRGLAGNGSRGTGVEHHGGGCREPEEVAARGIDSGPGEDGVGGRVRTVTGRPGGQATMAACRRACGLAVACCR